MSPSERFRRERVAAIVQRIYCQLGYELSLDDAVALILETAS